MPDPAGGFGDDAGGMPLRPGTAPAMGLVASAGLLLAGVLFANAHVDPDPELDALSLTISDYAVSDRGGAMDSAMIVLAVASLALLAGLAAAGLPVSGVPTVLVWLWSAGLAVSAAVPTDPVGTPMTAAGQVHRYVSVAASVSLPVAGLVLARRLLRPRWRHDPDWSPSGARLRRLAAGSGGLLLMLMYVAGPGDRVLMGLVERLLVIVEVLMLVSLVVPLLRAARTAAPAPHGPPHTQRHIG